MSRPPIPGEQGAASTGAETAPDDVSEAAEREDAAAFVRLGRGAVPVVVIHLAVIFLFLDAAVGLRLPAFLRSDLVLAWLWVNGAAVALAVWMWRKGRIPLAKGRWLGGRAGKRLLLGWIGLSLAWFLLPSLLRSAWADLTRPGGGW